MKRTPVCLKPSQLPPEFQPLLTGAAVFDSSCSQEARVYYIEKEDGYYLKTAPKGTLQKEASLTRFLHSKQLATEVLAYRQLEQDWLLTRRVPGEDCTDPLYLHDPKRLCDTTALLLRQLHETDFSGCPVTDHTAAYLETAKQNYLAGNYDTSYYSDGSRSVEEAWAVVQDFSCVLKNDTLLHGDYCLPNIMLNHWKFTGFIDVGRGGIGDRHVDLFWGAWTLRYNLKTDAYRQRFLDAYGKDRFDPEILAAIGAFEVFG